MASDPFDDVAADLDDLATDVEELEDDPSLDTDKVKKVEESLEKAKDVMDDIGDEQGPKKLSG